MKYADIIGEIIINSWIENVYKIQVFREIEEFVDEDTIKKYVYTIRFQDGSSIVGRVDGDMDVFVYDQVNQGFYPTSVTMSEKFINFVKIKLSAEYPKKEFIEEVYDTFNDNIVYKLKNSFKEDDEEIQSEVSKEYLEKCMLEAAEREDFETASKLKDKLKQI